MKLENRLRQLCFDHDQIFQQALANAVGATCLIIHSFENRKFNPSKVLTPKFAQFSGLFFPFSASNSVLGKKAWNHYKFNARE